MDYERPWLYVLRLFLVFLPSMFDTPHAFKWGEYTFVYHPSNMNEYNYDYLEKFLDSNFSFFENAVTILEKTDLCKPQGVIGSALSGESG